MRNRDPIGEKLLEAVESGVEPENAADAVLGFEAPEENQ